MFRHLNLLAAPITTVICLALLPTAIPPLHAAPPSVQELAPGVFFRLETDGCNNGWVVFDDYVLVVDANFPLRADEVVESIRATTDKPIRFVVNTHYHGDHAYGNSVYTDLGAVAVATEHSLHEFHTKGRPSFEANKSEGKDTARGELKNPTLLFDKKMIFDDGTHRVELLHFGHAHTEGDALVYLPQERILFTGDVCVNGAYNYTGDSDTANWIRVLESLQQLEVKTIAPGHGSLAGPELLALQRRWFTELRRAVEAGVRGSQTVEQIQQSLDIPFYAQWTGTLARERIENIRHVYSELTGMNPPAELLRLGLREGPSPTRSDPDWIPPRKIIVPNLSQHELDQLSLVAPDVQFVPAATIDDAVREVRDADAVVGYCSEPLVRAGKRLRWIQAHSAGVDRYVTIQPLADSPIVLTNAQRIYGPEIGDHVMGLLLAFTRRIRGSIVQQTTEGTWDRGLVHGTLELPGKTIMVVGLGGIGTQVARRAHGFGMRVMAIDPKVTKRPDFVYRLAKPEHMSQLLPFADVVTVCSPLTPQTRGMFGIDQFARMRSDAIFINVGRGPEVDTSALVHALRVGRIAAAGLDVTDPEPLPPGHPLWKMDNVIITPHIASRSDFRDWRRWLLYRENVRRFAAGEPLLSVVNKGKGY